MRERYKEEDSEIPFSHEHSPAAVERALAHFINPKNSQMAYEAFTRSLLKIGIGDESGYLTEYDVELQEGLESVLDDVKSARRFNETYIGHMLSEASIPGMLGYMIALRLGGNTVAREVSIRESELEPEAIRGLLEIVGYNPETASGTFTSGGTMANFTALTVARKLIQERYERIGQTAGTMRVLTVPQAHYSIPKSLDLLGGPGRQIELIFVETDCLRMSIKDLQDKIHQSLDVDNVPIMAIVAIAGETETGLVDPLSKIAEIAQKYDIFTIADGAYGAPYKLSKKSGKLFDGLEQFDAITLDPHKALYTPYSNGAVLFKSASDHARLAMGVRAKYVGFNEAETDIIQNLLTGSGSHGQKRIEGSMGAGPILSTVAVKRTLGDEGLAVVYDLTIDRAEHLYQKVTESPYLKPIHKTNLNLLCFTLTDRAEVQLGITNNTEREQFIEETRKRLDENIERGGGYFFSSTDLSLDEKDESGRRRTHYVWRACIMNPRTTDIIIEEAIIALEQIIEEKILHRQYSKEKPY